MTRLLLGVMIAAIGGAALAADCDALRARALLCAREERVRVLEDWNKTRDCCRPDKVKSYYVAALSEWMELLRAGCATTTDYIHIAQLHMEERDWRNAEAWCEMGVGISAELDTAPPPDARLMWAEALLAAGYPDASKAKFTAAAENDDLRRFTELGPPESWRESEFTTYRAMVAYAELLKDEPHVATVYLRAAAMTALKSGFVLAQRPHYAYADAIVAFSHSDQWLPIESQPAAIQMTVWRTIAVGEARLGDLDRAMAAIEKLFALCHLDPAGPTPCPAHALIPLPIYRGVGFEHDPSLLSEWYLIDQNMQALGYIVSMAFASVSWDQATGFPRADAKNRDFFGPINVDGYPNGRVSPEEDRVETELLPVDGNREAWLVHTQGRFEPFVKKFLANLARDIWSGRPEADEEPMFLGRTLTGLEAEINIARTSAKVADSTWRALQTGRRAHRLLLALIDSLNDRFYGHREPYGNPVWESYIAAQRFRTTSTLLILRELDTTRP